MRIALSGLASGVLALPAGHAYPVSGSASSAAPRAIRAIAVAESTATGGASLRLHDGVDASGDVVLPVTLVANESSRDYFGDGGLTIYSGSIYFELLSGSIVGSIEVA